MNGTSSIPYMIDGINAIQHLAIALKDRGLPSPREWRRLLVTLKELKTVTFLLGCEEKSWSDKKHIELRDLEEWYVDGRDRLISCYTGEKIDVRTVGSYMTRREFHRKGIQISPASTRAPAMVTIRVMAWKRIGNV
jgi:hypothetical protein